VRIALALLVLATSAHADLYRWIDPQTGSVKFSSVPPPPSQPGVEVVPYRGAASPAKPAPSATAALEQRWRELLGEIAQSAGSSAESAALQQRLRELAAANTELDRLDPAGAARRRAEAQGVLQRLLSAQP
jgi:hypothetical protein